MKHAKVSMDNCGFVIDVEPYWDHHSGNGMDGVDFPSIILDAVV